MSFLQVENNAPQNVGLWAKEDNADKKGFGCSAGSKVCVDVYKHSLYELVKVMDTKSSSKEIDREFASSSEAKVCVDVP